MQIPKDPPRSRSSAATVRSSRAASVSAREWSSLSVMALAPVSAASRSQSARNAEAVSSFRASCDRSRSACSDSRAVASSRSPGRSGLSLVSALFIRRTSLRVRPAGSPPRPRSLMATHAYR
ncbi:hypothetical protein M271_47660 [Streptomyces rapamycinicus NRRL 5491]|nr:hypothetical protein M271_47660 [Streptomyces rapamycinicus NRRL 5491]